MADSNDTRGWIMSIVSGIACVFGASIICVDILVRYMGKKDFRIQDSSAFLAASLSLSFGVMMFSALYSMLPSAKKSLQESGYSGTESAWILLGCFMAGFIGIQLFSMAMHHYIPSHVVECEHSHESLEGGQPSDPNEPADTSEHHLNGQASETTPLLTTSEQGGHDSSKKKVKKLSHCHSHQSIRSPSIEPKLNSAATSFPVIPANGRDSQNAELEPVPRGRRILEEPRPSQPDRRRSMIEVPKRIKSFVLDLRNDCNEDDPCFGYSEPCGDSCHRRASVFGAKGYTTLSSKKSSSLSRPVQGEGVSGLATSHIDLNDPEAQHHHHVPNAEAAFRNIGLQTSIAIALHKLPEGFITYSTNHANPSLGFSVFLALFVHNITEGFALALPLYLSLHSRLKAMLWASLLGGISQPLGAGIAALWFKIQGRDGHQPSTAVYGGMFAITSGIMVSVALQLFSESLAFNHNRNLCIGFGFIGMALMGASNALTSG